MKKRILAALLAVLLVIPTFVSAEVNDPEGYAVITTLFNFVKHYYHFGVDDSKASENIIKEVLKEAVFSGVSNLRYMDTILYEWSKNGIKTVEDVEKNRKKKNAQKEKEADIDLDIVEWSWFDDEE